MIDLLLHIADAEIEGFMKAILGRPVPLGIRPITFKMQRNPMRDSGVVRSGPDLTRTFKSTHRHAVLIWDHHGSGRELKQTPPDVVAEVSARMDSVTWTERHGAIVLVPELEEWLWHCEPALRAHFKIDESDLQRWSEEFALLHNQSVAQTKRAKPKELFHDIVLKRLGKTVSPRDFEQIGSRAGIGRLLHCPSFAALAKTLRGWFPPEPA